jgi:hypothetical protein
MNILNLLLVLSILQFDYFDWSKLVSLIKGDRQSVEYNSGIAINLSDY